MMRQLSAHEVLRLAPTLPGTETRAFFEPASKAVQILFTEVMVQRDLDHWEFGLVYKLEPALDGRYEPTRLVNYPAFRWEGPTTRAFGAGLGEFIRARAIEAYEDHLGGQEHYCQTRLRRPDLPNGEDLMRTLELIWETRRQFRARVGTG